MLTRRGALIGAALLPFGVRAETKFPDRPIKLIIPWAAAGPAYRDAMAKTYDEERDLLKRLNLLPA